MGCDKYFIDDDYNDYIMFSESDDEWSCLCTFPVNYRDEKLDSETLRSLALLGAAVVLYNHGDMYLPIYLPYAVPKWILNEIKRLIPDA